MNCTHAAGLAFFSRLPCPRGLTPGCRHLSKPASGGAVTSDTIHARLSNIHITKIKRSGLGCVRCHPDRSRSSTFWMSFFVTCASVRWESSGRHFPASCGRGGKRRQRNSHPPPSRRGRACRSRWTRSLVLLGKVKRSDSLCTMSERSKLLSIQCPVFAKFIQ